MKIKTIIDHVGHNIVGELIEETDSKIVLRSPAILIAQPNQNNQLQVQLYPVLFKEFLGGKSKEKGAVFTYNKERVVDIDAELDEKLTQQYSAMFAGGAVPAPAQDGKGDNEVIKLFDE
jgi:hypothetical protein